MNSHHPLHIPESTVQAAIRLEAGKRGIPLWRNNNGVTPPCEHCGGKPTRPVRYGLANDSKRVNLNIKSADLVGIMPTLILPQHVGSTMGQFYAREVKEFPWSYTGTPEEEAQARWLQLVIDNGGNAGFINSIRGL